VHKHASQVLVVICKLVPRCSRVGLNMRAIAEATTRRGYWGSRPRLFIIEELNVKVMAH